MFKIKCPIPYEFLNSGNECFINQLFGEAKNKVLDGGVFYGPEGHPGIDIKTTGTFKVIRGGLHTFSDDGTPSKGFWQRMKREPVEVDGRIPIYACHAGTLEYILNPEKQRQGWGVYLTADQMTEGDETVQYRTMYWHIEAPAHEIGVFQYKEESFWRKLANLFVKTRPRVREGEKIAVAGNNGMSQAPHLHLELHKRAKASGRWGAWKKIDPMPYFDTPAIVYHRWFGGENNEWWYQGEKRDRAFINELTANWPKTIV
jgi:hypothetical protein